MALIWNTTVVFGLLVLALLGVTFGLIQTRKTEAKLRRSEESLRTTLNSIGDAVIAADTEGVITRMNPEAEKLTGWEHGSGIGRKLPEVFRIIHARTLEPAPDPVQRVLETGEVTGLANHTVLIGKDGTERQVADSAAPIRGTDGGVTGVVLVFRDVTEDYKIRAALLESEERFRDLVEMLPEAVFETDVHLKLTFANRRALQMYGYSEADVALGLNGMDLIAPEDRQRARQNFARRLKGETLGNVEYLALKKDGTDFPVLHHVNIIMKDGRLIGTRGISVDITESKRAQELTQVRMRLLEFAPAHSLEEFLQKTLDETERLVDSCIGFYHFMEPDQKTLSLQTWSTATLAHYCQTEARGLHYAIDQAGVWVDCVRQRRPVIHNDYARLTHRKGMPQGHAALIRELVVPVFRNDRIVAILGVGNKPRAYTEKDTQVVTYLADVAWEIVQSKKADEQQKHLQNQLSQAQKLEAIGTLAGGIAHDFNNLLMAIQGRISLMAVDLGPSHPQHEHIAAIEEYVRSSTNLTQQLLGFARGGKYEVRPIEINGLVLNSAAMFSRTRKEIRIHTRTLQAPQVVEADKRQIEQVLLNLYVNAWQAMPDGGELFVETSAVSLDEAGCQPHPLKPGLYVKISVTDTGIGMDDSTRQRIFDPFFTTKEKSRGTGLGLASAYGIVKNHHGTITAYSEVGHGTTFNIYLPASTGKVHQETAPVAKTLRGTETILLVDDEEIIIDVGKAMLEKLGYRIFVANGGGQAIEVVARMGSDIDLVVLDLVMPDIDGGKAFDGIREILPDMPVMLSSGYAINDLAAKIMKRGCNGFIQKPFNLSELSRKVREILEDAKGDTRESIPV